MKDSEDISFAAKKLFAKNFIEKEGGFK